VSTSAYPAPRDPTAVLGPRIGAWVVDAVLFFALMLFVAPTPLSPLAEYVEVPPGFDWNEACDRLQESDDDVVGCLQIGDRVYMTDGADAAIQAVVSILWFGLVYVVWQGFTGMTPGKALWGLRVVGEDGQSPGMGRAFLRTILWVVDGAPWCIPAVGLITGLTSTGHRRVGDMAAKTFVIAKADAGRPPMVPGLGPIGAPPVYGAPAPYPGTPSYPVAPGTGPWGAPQGQPSSMPTAPPVSDQPPGATTPGPAAEPTAGPEARPAWAPATEPPEPPTAQPAEPPRPATDAEAKPAEAEAAQEPPTEPFGPQAADRAMAEPTVGAEAKPTEPEAWSPEPTPAAQPESSELGAEPEATREMGAEPERSEAPAEPAATVETPGSAAAGQPQAADASQAAEQQPGAGAQQPAGYNPQWDAARGTYIHWDAARSRWLQWDDRAKQWIPI
jgi:uncharacterized RDD family membrane protein YckC